MKEPLVPKQASSCVLTVTKNEIRYCWLSGMRLEEILPLCPDSTLIKQFVTNEFVRLEMRMKNSRVDYNSEGPLRLQ